MNIGRIAGIFALVAALYACDNQSTFDEHIAHAKQSIDHSDYAEAVVELKGALLKDRKSAEARWLLGKIYFETGDEAAAEKELQKALELGWSKNDVVPILAEVYLAQGSYDLLWELGEPELDSLALASLISTRALAAKALGERHNAITLVNRALDIAPDSVAAMLAKTRILVGEGDFSGAEIVLENAMPHVLNRGSAWSLMGDIHVGLKRPEEALAAYDNAIALQKNDHATLFKRALLHVQLRNYQAAQLDTTALLRATPQHSGPNYVQGIIHFQAGRYAEAITPLGIGARDFKRFPLALFFLSCTNVMTGSLGQASVLAQDFQKLVPDSIRGRKLLSFIRLLQGKYDDVWFLLSPVLQSNADDVGALKLISSAMLLDNRVTEGFSYMSSLAALGTETPYAQIRLGPGRLLGGYSDDAAQYLETDLELGPDFQQAEIFSVLRHLHNGDYEEAIRAAQSYRALNPRSTIPLNLLGSVYQSAERHDQARESFEKALKFDAADPASNHELAQMAVGRGDLVTARQRYTTVLESKNDDLFTLLQLAHLDEKEEKEDSFVWLLQRAIMAHEGALEPRLLLGQYHLRSGRPEKVALQFMNMEEVQQQLPEVLRLNALANLAKEERLREDIQQEAIARLEGKEQAQPSVDVDMETWARRLIVRKIRQIAPVYGLDPSMVMAVVRAESNFNPGARSHANAVGLMQLIPATAARFGVLDRTNPVQNLNGGMAYLRWLLSFFDGDLRLALAGYNAGEGAVTKYLGVPPYPETQDYVRKVIRFYGRNRHPPIEAVVKPTRHMSAIRAKQVNRI